MSPQSTLKRYPEYKHSGSEAVGMTPTRWDDAQLRRYCRVVSGGTPNKSNLEYWDEGDIPWLSSGAVNRRRIRTPDALITRAGLENSSAKWIPAGSVLMALAGQGKTKGTVATLEFGATCNQSLAALLPRPSAMDYRFLAYFLESRYKDIRSLAGNDLRDGLNLQDVRSIQISAPPLDEQQQIARFLEHVDRRVRQFIRSKRRLIELLNEQKQAIIHRTVTRGLDPDVRLKPSGVDWLGDVPEHWEIVTVRQMSSLIQTGPFGSQLHADEYVDGGIPVINPSHLKGGRLTASTSVSVDNTTAERLGRHRLHVGDVLFARRGELGRCGLVRQGENGWLCGTGCLMVRPRKEFFEPEYLITVLSSRGIGEWLSLMSVGATMDNLNTSIVGNLQLPRPPDEEQRAILAKSAESGSSLISRIHRAQRQIELVREYRTRLIADVVTGKLDVRGVELPDEDEVDEALEEPIEEEEGGEAEEIAEEAEYADA